MEYTISWFMAMFVGEMLMRKPARRGVSLLCWDLPKISVQVQVDLCLRNACVFQFAGTAVLTEILDHFTPVSIPSTYSTNRYMTSAITVPQVAQILYVWYFHLHLTVTRLPGPRTGWPGDGYGLDLFPRLQVGNPSTSPFRGVTWKPPPCEDAPDRVWHGLEDHSSATKCRTYGTSIFLFIHISIYDYLFFVYVCEYIYIYIFVYLFI